MGASSDTCSKPPAACCQAAPRGSSSSSSAAPPEARPRSTIELRAGGKVLVHPKGTALAKFYEPEKVLGEGRRAKVRKCRGLRSNAQRVCKTFPKAFLEQSKLLNEFELLSTLQTGGDGAHILRLFEIFESEDALHVIVELCIGGELYDRQAQLGLFSEPEVSEIFRQMLEAVQHMHAHDIVHRDLKLENWLLVDQLHLGIKLSDFAMSTHLPPGALATEKVGSPYYVAPEVLSGAYDRRVDLWSLGVLLYMMLSGNPPFDGKESASILVAVQKACASFDGRCWVAVSASVRELVARYLSRDPALRPAPAETLRMSWLNHCHRAAQSADDSI